MVRYWMPSSIAARTVRRTASTPRRCPSDRGRPRSLAQRPLPSIMMATCRGTSVLACQIDLLFCSFMDQASYPPPGTGSAGFASHPVAVGRCTGQPSYLLDLGFLAGQRLVDLLDELIGQILYFARILVMVVLAHLSILVEALQQLHAVTAHVAHSNAGMLRILMGDLDEFLAPLGGQRRNRQPDERTGNHRIEAEVGFPNGLFHGAHLATVPNLHRDRARVRRRNRCHLIDRQALAIDVHHHGIEEMYAGAPGAQTRELLFE